jgi:hypothetical protein
MSVENPDTGAGAQIRNSLIYADLDAGIALATKKTKAWGTPAPCLHPPPLVLFGRG